MRKPFAVCGALVIGLWFGSASGAAHHPIAPQFDAEREVVLEGTVEAFEWTSPHSTLELSTGEGDAQKTWTIELDADQVLDELGWTRNTVTRGQQVRVMAWPARDGGARALARSVRLESGRELAAINPHDPAYAQFARRDPPAADGATAQQVTLVGCVELESDYRRRTGAGPGGVLGTGLGISDEFVLVDARPAPAELAAGAAVGTSGDAPSGAGEAREPARREGATAGAVGTSGQSSVFMLSGDQEADLARAVGRQVHLVGVMEERAEREPGGAERIGDLPRIAISVWHPVNDFCPAQPQ